jgi:hypothetical protein
MKLDVSFYVLRIADKFCERDGEYAIALNKIKCSLAHARWKYDLRTSVRITSIVFRLRAQKTLKDSRGSSGALHKPLLTLGTSSLANKLLRYPSWR